MGIVIIVGGFLAWQHHKNQPPPPPYKTLIADFGYINNDISNQSDMIQIEADCQHLLTDIQDADTFDSTPSVLDNPTAGSEWSDFVSKTEVGASDCVNGIKNNDEQQYLRAPSELKASFTPLLQLVKSQG